MSNGKKGNWMERNLTTEAVVLASRRWGEVHRIITLLCPSLGICEARVYGARKGKLAGGIEQFSTGLFYLYHNPARGTYTVVDVQPASTQEVVRGDLKRIGCASVMAELAIRMHGGEYQELYALMRACLSLLDQEEFVADVVLIQFIWRFIGIMGLEPDLTRCPICGTGYGEQDTLFFNVSLLSPCCSNCSDRADQTLLLGPGSRRYLSFTRRLGTREAVGIPVHEEAICRLERYITRYAETILGGPLRSLAAGLSTFLLA